MENRVVMGLLWVLLLVGGSSTLAQSGQKLGESALSGDYYFGTGFADNQKLRLLKDGTFNFSSAGSFLYAKFEGTYAIERGILILSPKTPDDQENLTSKKSPDENEIKVTRIDDYSRYPTRFLPVEWGERLYLVAENEIVDFCNSVNLGSEPRKEIYGEYFLRWGDEKKPAVTRLPVLPQQWQGYLLERPIKGSVVSIEENKFAIVDIGGRQGLKVNMILGAQNKCTQWVALKIITVEEGIVRAEIQDITKKLEVGDRVSSKLH